ncbi:lipocalin-like domain-containing protein [soil metagenome]
MSSRHDNFRLALLLCIFAHAAGCQRETAEPAFTTDRLLDRPTENFAKAMQPGAIRFPVDHGPHPRYRTEWWYFTGNLLGGSQRHFGYELTFFRYALADDASSRSSAWATDQIYMAHFAVTDTAGDRHLTAERIERAALDLAGARATPFRVWVVDWSAASVDEALFPMRLRAQSGDAEIDLNLVAEKPVVLHGDRGLSRKGAAPGNASYYYSFTRLATSGSLRIGDSRFDVAGRSWFDREWSTSSLEDDGGWDWFALQLDDGTDIMFYRLRRADGTSSPFSGGSIVAADGSRRPLAAADVVVESRDTWTSQTSGITYPMGWRLRVPGLGLALNVEPVLQDQEMDLSVRYWEGAVRVHGRAGNGRAVTGDGYVELAGYGGPVPGT